MAVFAVLSSGKNMKSRQYIGVERSLISRLRLVRFCHVNETPQLVSTSMDFELSNFLRATSLDHAPSLQTSRNHKAPSHVYLEAPKI